MRAHAHCCWTTTERLRHSRATRRKPIPIQRFAIHYVASNAKPIRGWLTNPSQYLEDHESDLVILDEVHRVPEIFQQLRGVIDRGRRRGKANGRLLLLGSAAMDLLKQSGESLAGRVSYLELGPFDVLEAGAAATDILWVRGGFPRSFLAESDDLSLQWRRDFIRTYLERDIPQFGPRIPAETLRRFWTMLAHNQAQILNAASLARGLAVDGKTVAGYLDLLVDLLVVRRLPAWHRNVGKRLVKSPKVYVRDTGIAHALLGIRDKEALLGHPVVGQTWESFIIETLITTAPDGTEAHYYRTSNGTEIDLLLTLPNRDLWAIEVKRSSAPKIERGFHSACADLKPHKRFFVYAGICCGETPSNWAKSCARSASCFSLTTSTRLMGVLLLRQPEFGAAPRRSCSVQNGLELNLGQKTALAAVPDYFMYAASDPPLTFTNASFDWIPLR